MDNNNNKRINILQRNKSSIVLLSGGIGSLCALSYISQSLKVPTPYFFKNSHFNSSVEKNRCESVINIITNFRGYNGKPLCNEDLKPYFNVIDGKELSKKENDVDIFKKFHLLLKILEQKFQNKLNQCQFIFGPLDNEQIRAIKQFENLDFFIPFENEEQCILWLYNADKFYNVYKYLGYSDKVQQPGTSLGEEPTKYLCSCVSSLADKTILNEKLWTIQNYQQQQNGNNNNNNIFKFSRMLPLFPSMCRRCINCVRYFDGYYKLIEEHPYISFSSGQNQNEINDDRQLEILAKLKFFQPYIKVITRNVDEFIKNELTRACKERERFFQKSIIKEIKKRKPIKVQKTKKKNNEEEELMGDEFNDEWSEGENENEEEEDLEEQTKEDEIEENDSDESSTKDDNEQSKEDLLEEDDEEEQEEEENENEEEDEEEQEEEDDEKDDEEQEEIEYDEKDDEEQEEIEYDEKDEINE